LENHTRGPEVRPYISNKFFFMIPFENCAHQLGWHSEPPASSGPW
jgi:hypothetical protein